MFKVITEKFYKTLGLGGDFEMKDITFDQLHEYQLTTQYDVFELGPMPLILTYLE